MKASELIKELQETIEKHGDLPVKFHVDDWAGGTDEEVAAVLIKYPGHKLISYFKLDY